MLKKTVFFVILTAFALSGAACDKKGTGSSSSSQQTLGASSSAAQAAGKVEQMQGADGLSYGVISKSGYADLSAVSGQKIVLEGTLTGEKFSHLVYFHPPYEEIAHYNLDADSVLGKELPHIVIYFKKKTDMDKIYFRHMDKKSRIYGTLGKVEGSMANPDREQVRQRKAHTEYYVDVDKIEEVK